MKTVRLLNDLELAELSCEWENAKVDTSRYFQNVSRCFEVDQDAYAKYKNDGVICQVFDNRFYVAF